MSKPKNDIAWEKIFKEHSILNGISKNGHMFISSNEINRYREARLMTKFDHRAQLPQLFSDNQLSILPVSRGSYVIGAFDTFHDFNLDEIEITMIDFPTVLESLDFNNITSEATAINCAFVSNILNDFTGEENLLPTVSGRMSSLSFDFNINLTRGLFKVNVNNSQIEIDGGFEGDSSLTLIEAKNYISNDFLIRQLFYPYKLWANKIRKKVRPVFMTYTNGIFHLIEYSFDSINHYNSLHLVKQKKYAIQDRTLNIETLNSILTTIDVTNEPNIPFPQADSFERLINLCELLKCNGVLSKEDITQNFDFDARQTDYYTNAGKYLGIINCAQEENMIGCSLTVKGQHIFNQPIIGRQIEFVKMILSHLAFKNTLELYMNTAAIPTKEEVVIIMKNCKVFNIEAESTYFRRSSTILGWINWILNQLEE